ncbi:MAG: DMT family transporter [Litorivicinus sp.]
MIYELAAIGAATLWACTAIISTGPAKLLGAVHFNFFRMGIVLCMLTLVALLTGGFDASLSQHAGVLLLSGLVGIFLGDTLMFSGLRRLGPRRNQVLFATNAPIAALIGWVFLGESLGWAAIAGVGLVTAGVATAVFMGRRSDETHALEDTDGRLWIGVSLALGAALCQALGLVISRPAMEAGVDPVAASVLRVGMAFLGLTVSVLIQKRGLPAVPAPRVIGQIAISGLLGMGLGMTLVQFALMGAKAGVVATLSSTSPVLILPVLWLIYRRRPAFGAWIGAILAVLGASLLFLV